MSLPTFLMLLLLMVGAQLSQASEYALHSFRKLQLTPEFWSEGAGCGDFDRDGVLDIVSGPYWYEGPAFKQRHEFYPATRSYARKSADGIERSARGWDPQVYSDNFFAFSHDFNGDQWPDILVIGFPGRDASWFENPQGKDGLWKRHMVFEAVDNESPHWCDLTGDGKPEIICNHDGHLGYVTPDWTDPAAKWTFHGISPKGDRVNFTHGLGVGDVNADGRKDVLEKGGWWEQPPSLKGDPLWKDHAFDFGPGGAQMHVYDVNGDGLNDVITSLIAHGFGLAWFEQIKQAGQTTFRQHTIMNKEPRENRYGLKFSMLHAVELVDMDGDGLKDIVTGKRFWLPGYRRETEPGSPSPIYWFKLVRSGQEVDFLPYPIDPATGIGVHLTVADINADRLPDVVMANKQGAFVFLHEVKKVEKPEWEKARPKPK